MHRAKVCGKIAEYNLLCACDGIGRHAGFRFPCRKTCGFESLQAHQKERHRLGVSLFGYAPLARLFNTRGAYPLLRAKSRPSGGCALAQRLRALALSCSPHAKMKALSFIRIHRADATAALPALDPRWASQLRRGRGLRTKAPVLWCLNNSKPIPRRSPC